MKQYTATANDDGVRLSRFVQSVTRDFPTSLLYKSFRNKRVKVNGKKAAPEYRLQTGDLIELYINDEFFPPEGAKPVQKAAPKKQPNQPRVTVIYEDENLAVLYKPTHLLCHSDRTGDANLVDAFTQYLTQKGEYDPHGENRFKPGICNRLDRGTEGLVIAAKNYAALRDMNEIIRTDLLKRSTTPSRWAFRSPGGSPHGGSTTRKTTRSASTPINRRTSAASRSLRMWTYCAPQAPLPCAKLALSPAAPIRSAPIWPIWASRCWAISNTATAK